MSFHPFRGTLFLRRNYRNQRAIFWFALVLLAFATNLQAAHELAPTNRILILISLDAFRSDYLQKFNPPNLNRLAKEGVHAEKLIPVFPSMTFPNHQTIATGLWPEHHGIIHNDFYDPVFKEKFGIVNNPG